MARRQTIYVVITPARDEASFLPLTAESMLRQTLPPAEWIIVDDGSRDRTAGVIEEYANRCPWIRGVRRQDRGRRLPGAGVVEAFYDGFHCLASDNWEFLVKLDGDLSFAPDFFERALGHFDVQPRLGIGGARLYQIAEGVLQVEHGPQFHVRGATKIYRRECWKAIGGLQAAPGWDTVDEIRARMQGWNTESFFDVLARHHRPTGGTGHWRDMIKRGQGCYVAGYHPVFVAARCLRQLTAKPYVAGALGMGAGFVSGYMGGLKAPRDPALVHYVHEQQWRRLWGGESMWQ